MQVLALLLTSSPCAAGSGACNDEAAPPRTGTVAIGAASPRDALAEALLAVGAIVPGTQLQAAGTTLRHAPLRQSLGHA